MSCPGRIGTLSQMVIVIKKCRWLSIRTCINSAIDSNVECKRRVQASVQQSLRATTYLDTFVVFCHEAQEARALRNESPGSNQNHCARHHRKSQDRPPHNLFFPNHDRQCQRCTVETTRRARRYTCLLYTSPSPRDLSTSRMPSSA